MSIAWAAGEIEITDENFPDAIFRAYVEAKFGTVATEDIAGSEIKKDDIYLTTEKINEATEIDLTVATNTIEGLDEKLTGNLAGKTLKDITDLTGINLFTALTTLNASGLYTPEDTQNSVEASGITTLDVSALTQLTTLNVSGCEMLETLDVSECNGLKMLDVSGCVGLREYMEAANGIPASGLNLGNVNSFTHINISNTGMNALDVSTYTALVALSADNTGVEGLNFTNNTALKTLSLVQCGGSEHSL